jgi:hypothetical protein
MNETLPNIAQPDRMPWTVDVANNRSRKSGSGRIGSAARRSTHNSRTNNAMDTLIKIQLDIPVIIKPSRSITTLTVSSAAPA